MTAPTQMAGYSGTPLPKQLGITQGERNKVCAIDETSSGLRFALRRELR